MAWAFRDGGSLEWMQSEETATMKHLRAEVDTIVKRYAALALGEDSSAQNTDKPANM